MSKDSRNHQRRDAMIELDTRRSVSQIVESNAWQIHCLQHFNEILPDICVAKWRSDFGGKDQVMLLPTVPQFFRIRFNPLLLLPQHIQRRLA
jgi:hypothetical protein